MDAFAKECEDRGRAGPTAYAVSGQLISPSPARATGCFRSTDGLLWHWVVSHYLRWGDVANGSLKQPRVLASGRVKDVIATCQRVQVLPEAGYNELEEQLFEFAGRVAPLAVNGKTYWEPSTPTPQAKKPAMLVTAASELGSRCWAHQRPR